MVNSTDECVGVEFTSHDLQFQFFRVDTVEQYKYPDNITGTIVPPSSTLTLEPPPSLPKVTLHHLVGRSPFTQ
jgi:hypothetical protein